MTEQTMPSPTELAEILNSQSTGYDQLLGLKFVTATLEEIVAELEIGPQHHQPHGLVHGGLYASMVETLCSVGASLQVFAQGHTVVGLDNHTSFLRATGQGVITGTATQIKRGRRSEVWRTDIVGPDGKLLATGQVRLLVLEKAPEAG